jgi:EAL domain-containing protein (putative c-di-GMP-specific phosphodiesterase class I)
MINLLQKIKKLNLTLSIDDFGSGYSSFSYLKKMPIDRIKIDKILIDNIEKDKDNKAIVSSIVALAKIMGLKTIAEGVESKAQEDVVFECGCDAIQGFLYSKPLPSDEFEREFLKR